MTRVSTSHDTCVRERAKNLCDNGRAAGNRQNFGAWASQRATRRNSCGQCAERRRQRLGRARDLNLAFS
jgi:hypothetical protein